MDNDKLKELQELREIRDELRNKCGNDFSVRDEYWLNRTEQTIKKLEKEQEKENNNGKKANK